MGRLTHERRCDGYLYQQATRSRRQGAAGETKPGCESRAKQSEIRQFLFNRSHPYTMLNPRRWVLFVHWIALLKSVTGDLISPFKTISI